MIGWLTIVLRLVVLAILLNQLVLLLRWPAAIYRVLLPIWKALRYGPGVSLALRRTALAAASRGEVGIAMHLSREAVQRGLLQPAPSVPLDVLNLAQMLRRSGQPAAAAQWLVLADESTGDDSRWKPAILIALGACLTHLDRYQDAESVLERASYLCEESPRWRGVGMDFHRWSLGRPQYRRQVADARGYLAVQSERFEDARRWYKILEQLPGTTPRHERLRILNNLAYSSVELGDLTKAEQYVDQAERLAHNEVWAGMDSLLGTRGALRLAQGRVKEARDDLTHKLMLRGPDNWTLTLLARTAFQEGAFGDASGYLDQIRVEPKGVRSRRELAEMLERSADIDEENGRTAAADARRQRAKLLGEGLPPAAAPSDDPLLAAARSTLAGKRFTGLSTFGDLALGVYLGGLLGLALSIVLVQSPPAGVVLLQAVLLTIFIVVGAPFTRWLMGPKQISGPAPAA